jgi:hypothetical protein
MIYAITVDFWQAQKRPKTVGLRICHKIQVFYFDSIICYYLVLNCPIVNQTNFSAFATSSGVSMAGEAQVVSFTPMPIPFSNHRNCSNISVFSNPLGDNFATLRNASALNAYIPI